MTPSVALTTSITIDGEARTLKYGLLAFKALGLNPFDKDSIDEFGRRTLDLGMMALLIHSGLLHEYHGKAALRRGQVPPSVDDLLADFVPEEFGPACLEIFELLKADTPKDEGAGENPPQA